MDTDLRTRLYDVDGARTLDATAIAGGGVSGLELMSRAGAAVFRVMRERWPHVERVVVVCGQGNNAGDGYVCARLAHDAGYRVSVLQIGDPRRLGEDAGHCREAMVAAGVSDGAAPEAIDAADLIVDAVFGIGLTREVGEPFAGVLERINRTSAPVISIDVPSGINADTGCRMGTAVRAAVTVTFICMKQGLFTGDGPEYSGAIEFDGIGVPHAVYANVAPRAALLSIGAARGLLAPRPRTAHKGSNGHVLLVGGAPGYSGAIRLAGEAAARVGAGLVSVAGHPQTAASINATRPELMVHATASGTALRDLLRRASVVAIGPGLGQSAWAVELLQTVLDTDLPLVVDADALNLLAAEPVTRGGWVLTPHPGEAARLLQIDVPTVQGDRFAAARKLQDRYGGSVVLKGAGSIICDGESLSVLACGNPGMASGGMGDVLTGVIAGLAAQGLPIGAAAAAGACIHSTAADRAAAAGERGLLASDLMPHIRELVN